MSSKYIDIGRGVNFTNDANTYGTNSNIYMNLSNSGVFNIYNPLANTSLVNIYGGLSINHTSDITSLTQGGALTIAGGSVVLGNTFIGRNLYLGNNLNTSGLVTVNTQTSGNMFTGTWLNTAGNIKAFNITTPTSGNDAGLDSVVFDNPNAFALIVDPTANVLNSGSRLFIDGTWGNVNIGTSTPVNSNAPLYLFGTGEEVNFQIRNNNSQSSLRLAVTKVAGVVLSDAISTASMLSNDIGAVQIGSGLNGTSANRIYFSTRGNIGINNTNPNFILDVSGTANVLTSVTTSSVSITNNTTTNMVSIFTTTSNCNSLNSTVSNIFNTTGSISIGTLNASTGITTSTLNFTGTLSQNGAAVGSSPWGSGTGGNLFYTNGNVGINTTAPNFSLDVRGTSGMSIQTNATFSSVFITTTGNVFFSNNINTYGNMVNNTGNSLAFTSNIKTLNNRLRISRANATSCVNAWYLRVSTTGASLNALGP